MTRSLTGQPLHPHLADGVEERPRMENREVSAEQSYRVRRAIRRSYADAGPVFRAGGWGAVPEAG